MPALVDDEPKVFAAFAFALIEFAAEALGHDRHTLRELVQLDASLLGDLDAQIPYETLPTLWKLLVTHHPDEPLGLRYANLLDLEQLGVLGHLVLHSASLRESIARFIRFQVLLDPFFKMTFCEADEHAILTIDHEPRVRALIEPMEMFCAVMCRSTLKRVALQNTHHPLRVIRFAHPRRHALHHYDDLFGAPVLFDQPDTSVTFERALLDAPMLGAQPTLSHYIEHYLQNLLESLRDITRDDASPPQTASEQVRAFLVEHLRDGLTQQADAAHHLRTSARTLQRRLAAERTSFANILNEVRRAQAQHLLTTTQLPIYEIAYFLGYQDVPSFYRAFKQWTHTTPELARRSAKSGDAAAQNS